MKLYRIDYTDCTNAILRDRSVYTEHETMKQAKEYAKQYFNYGCKTLVKVEYIGIGGYDLLDELRKEGKA